MDPTRPLPEEAVVLSNVLEVETEHCAFEFVKVVSPVLPVDELGVLLPSRSCPSPPAYQVFIDSKNSEFVLVCFSFEIRNSIASVVPIGFRMRRSR